jgi:hypothetical protein
MNLYQKLLEVKKKIPYIKKDSRNFQYTYASPTVVLGSVNPILNELGVLLLTHVIDSTSQRIEIETKNGIKKEWLYDLSLIFEWVNCEKPEEKIAIPFRASGCNGEEKGLGSALTYAERYFILKQFNIPTDDDDPDKVVRELQKSVKADTTAAITAARAATSIEELQQVWNANTALHGNAEFKAVVSECKSLLTGKL